MDELQMLMRTVNQWDDNDVNQVPDDDDDAPFMKIAADMDRAILLRQHQ